VELVECVPNISEGRRAEVVDACVASVREVDGVTLLDRTSDPDHDRSVVTFAGPPQAVTVAMRALATEAIARIDLRQHHGRHPRIGALDVAPFVPLGDTSMATCVELATRFGDWLAARYRLPVFLYARAARRQDREVLADIRRPGFEGLRAALAAPGGAPDIGPARPHPTAGATVTGARPFLVAWNIQLDTTDLTLARDIAGRIRERGGGLPAVQALGIPLDERGCVQVSMNLLDVARTPMWQVLERVRELATVAGVAIRDSELIGVAPLRAFLDTADHAMIDTDRSTRDRVLAGAQWLHIRGASSDMALELRLERLHRDAPTDPHVEGSLSA
jgi:glutamate formiminotransferase